MINNGKWIVFAHLMFHAWPREFSLEKSSFYHSSVRKARQTWKSCWTIKLQQFSREQSWINYIPQEVVDIRYLNEPTLAVGQYNLLLNGKQTRSLKSMSWAAFKNFTWMHLVSFNFCLIIINNYYWNSMSNKDKMIWIHPEKVFKSYPMRLRWRPFRYSLIFFAATCFFQIWSLRALLINSESSIHHILVIAVGIVVAAGPRFTFLDPCRLRSINTIFLPL